MKLSQEEIQLLRRIEDYLTPSTTTDLLYRTEAQTLRHQADLAEAKEKDVELFGQFIRKDDDKSLRKFEKFSSL